MQELVCQACGEDFEARRRDAKFCSTRCRKRAQRHPGSRAAVDQGTSVAAIGLVIATEAELEAAGKTDSVLGQLAIQLARRVATAGPAESGFSGLVKEFRAVRAEVLGRDQKQSDPVDEVKQRREAKAREAATQG